jgi:tetrahydromethanopterin S-methyltransferase subunit C
MSQFRNWYVRNQDAITWFIIGFLSMSMLVSLSNGSYIWAAIDAIIIYANYKIRDFRMQ